MLTLLAPVWEVRHCLGQASGAALRVAPSMRSSFNIAMRRLCQSHPHADDEGYESLLYAPALLEQMRACFTALRDQIEMLASR